MIGTTQSPRTRPPARAGVRFGATVLHDEPCAVGRPFWKFGLDIAGALTALVLLSPVFVITAMVVRLVSPGPVIFKQQRVGRHGRPFMIWKFRTLHVGADSGRHEAYVADLVGSDQVLEKLNRTAELIPLGRWLRALCIDELPQLFNVLCGQMSLVGPRPDVLPYEAYHPWQRQRFEVLPGLTGLWQVSGKNRTTFTEMIRLDITYVEQCSLWLDLRVLLMTLPAIVRQCLANRAT